MKAVAPDIVRDQLRRYRERGFDLVFYDPRKKGPGDTGWPSRHYDIADYRPGQNVGVKTGTEIAPGRFLCDVDVDWPGGEVMTGRLLPDTPFTFGRESKILSHLLCTTSTPLAWNTFKDVDGSMLVELRGTTEKGAIGLQTMLPPSVHPTGEKLYLHCNDDEAVAHVPDNLLEHVRTYAIACILLKHLGQRGFGHDVRLAVAGFLLKSRRLSVDHVVALGEALASTTTNDVTDVASTVRSTATRLERGEKVSGRTALVKALGPKGTEVVARIDEWLGIKASDIDVSDGIQMCEGQLPKIVDQAETALLKSPTRIYQRGGALVHPVKLDAPTGDAHDVEREMGSTVLASVSEPWLLEQMARAVPWYTDNKKAGAKRADPRTIYARTLLSRKTWSFPALRGVLPAPTLARGGRIIEVPGFDSESGLLLDFPAGTFPPVPVNPTKDDAHAALQMLAQPMRGFPFVNAASRSVALSAVLTALVRVNLRTAPLHAFDAPTAGTGKSMLAEMAGLLATGARPPALSQGKTPEEDEKRLATVLFAGDPVIHLDNCERPLSGDFLCSMLTQERVQARILGLSERRVLPSTALVLASGNNLTFEGDISRRAVRSRLDAGVERPDARDFDFDCHAEVLAARPELVVAALTILRAYAVAEHPVRVPAIGSFADYAWIRGALVWLECADPKDTLDEILDDDPKKDELRTVMDLWAAAFGNEWIEVAAIDRHAEETSISAVATPAQALHGVLVDVACRGVWNAKSVGWWLRRHKDRVVGDGKVFRCEKGSGDRQRWQLVGATAQSGARPAQSPLPTSEWERYGPPM